MAAGFAEGVEVRIGTMNVCNLGNPEKRAAFSEILQRVQPDILALQECSSGDEEWLTAVCASTAKPLVHRAFMPPPGTGRTKASTDKVAIFSRWPIQASAIVKECQGVGGDQGAVEFMRWPIHAEVAVPGALNPLHVITLHSAASTVDKPRRIWRGLEAYRVRRFVEEQILGVDSNDVEYVILGDMNDSADGRWGNEGGAANFQPEQFTYKDFHFYETNDYFKGGFRLGYDHPWYETNEGCASHTMCYRKYPTERYGDVFPVTAYRTGSGSNWVTEWKSDIYRLDYILFSREIMNSAYGGPRGEVYDSRGDGEGVGLRKCGVVPDCSVSTNATDHLMVFSDFHMIDEVGGLTPVVILSEVADYGADRGANFVEICNTGSGRLDVEGYTLELYLDGATVASGAKRLEGVSLEGGGTYWVAADGAAAGAAWGCEAGGEWGALGQMDGNDTIILRNAGGGIQDVYGAIGVDGGGEAWAYRDCTARRVAGVTEPLTAWDAREWQIVPTGADEVTPGRHRAVLDADVGLSEVLLHAVGRASTAPRATEGFYFSAMVYPNAAASNLTAEVRFRVDGGVWVTNAMTNMGDAAWRSADLEVARGGGSVMDYQARVMFAGPGDWSPVISGVVSYTFPGETNAVGGIGDVLFNEVKTSTESDEFIELVGGAGREVGGWSVTLYSSNAAVIWAHRLAEGAKISGAGVTDEWGNPLGFYVLGGSDGVGGADEILVGLRDGAKAGLMANSARVLVLRDRAGAVVDAVALASTNAFVEMRMPEDVSTSVARGAGNFLHCLGAAEAGAGQSVQAPDNVRTGCQGMGLYRLPEWRRGEATPGGLNVGQTTGQLVLARVDRDADGLLDDEDNCPGEANTVQSDIDGDGFGDVCDLDMDGDGIGNEADNCATEYNPTQEDHDGDGIGDACDPDYDEEGLEGVQERIWVTFEGVSKAEYAAGVIQDGGREWSLTDGLVGTSDADQKVGMRAMRAKAGMVFQLSGVLSNGLETLSFDYGPYGGGAGLLEIVVEVLGEGGVWEEVGRVGTGAARELTHTNLTGLGVGDGSGFRMRAEGGGGKDRVNIDNIQLLSVVRARADCDLRAGVRATYDGEAHTNAFIFYPEGCIFHVRYRDETLGVWVEAPVEIGRYSARVEVETTERILGGIFEFPDSVVIEERVQPPEVRTGEAEQHVMSARLSGVVTAHSTTGLPAMFEYGEGGGFGNKVLAEPGAVQGESAVAIGVRVGGLSANTLYSWRALCGGVAGETKVFTTESPRAPEVIVSEIGATNFRVGWGLLEDVTNYVVDVHTGGGEGGEVAEHFADWAKDTGDEGGVRVQEGAGGQWSYEGARVYLGNGSGMGSSNTVYLRGEGSYLMLPALDGVHVISVLARRAYRVQEKVPLILEASEDGGVTFSEVATFLLESKEVTSNGYEWATAGGSGVILRLRDGGGGGAYVHDVYVGLAGGGRKYVEGMPADVAGSEIWVGGLGCGVTYAVRVKSQYTGGLESGWSVVTNVTTAGGMGPSFSLSEAILRGQVGVETGLTFTVGGEPEPEVWLEGAAEVAGGCGLEGGHLWYRPAAADLGLRRFRVVASNGLGCATLEVAVEVNAVAPVLGAGREVTGEGFTIDWEAVAAASGYGVEVSTDAGFGGGGGGGLELFTSFEEGQIPAGWEVGHTNGDTPPKIVTNTSYAAQGTSCSLQFSAKVPGRYIRTPRVEAPGQLRYYYYVTSAAAWSMVVQVSTDGTNWVDVDTNSTVAAVKPAAEHRVDLSEYSGVYIRLIDRRGEQSTAQRYLDEVTVTRRASGLGGERRVEGTSFTTNGLASGTTYYIRARTWYEGEVVSGWSATGRVTTVGGAGGGMTQTPVPVPFGWLALYYGERSAGEYEALAAGEGANGLAVYVSYALGLDPREAGSELVITIVPESGGKRLEILRADGGAPPEGVEVRYVLEGVTNLTGGEGWADQASSTVVVEETGRRFFRLRAVIAE